MDYEKFKEENKELIEETDRELNNNLNAEFYIATTLKGKELSPRRKHFFN